MADTLTPEQSFELKKMLWVGLRAETLQEMKSLDSWIMFIVGLLILLIVMSRIDKFQDLIVWAAIAGSVGMVWIGRKDVLIHRPAGPTKQVENSFGQIALSQKSVPNFDVEPAFKGWENWYKARLSLGVKVLVPLDALAGVFMFTLFVHANNAAFKYLATSSYRGYFWWGCMLVHFVGWAIIGLAKPLAE